MGKKILLITAFLFICIAGFPDSGQFFTEGNKDTKPDYAGNNPEKAAILVDLSQHPNAISPLIYGQFIEFLGRCIDGGIYEEGSPLSESNGFRKDVLQAVKELKPTIIRFPGGTVTKIYHWEDGIGDENKRPPRKNLIWGGIIDNHFGTAEFIEYCHEIGAEPFLVVNMATGTPEEASNWVEYCNGTGDTFYANLRRSHGYEKPFNVKYWGIGNEESAVPDAGKDQKVSKYIEDGWQFVKLMKLQDPTIKITLDGNPADLNWGRKIMAEMNPVCDFLSVHFYAMPADSTYDSLLQSVENFNQSFDSMRTIIRTVPGQVKDFSPWYRFPPRQNPVKLAIDEWGIWDMSSGKGTGTYQLEYLYNWADALAVGKFLNLFQRNSDIIGLATWAQTVNVLAPVMTSKEGSFCQTVYTPLQAFRRYSLENHLPIGVTSPLLNDNLKSIDATATISADGKELVISLLNLSVNEAISTKVVFKLPGKNSQLQFLEHIGYTAPSLGSTNTFGKNCVNEIKTNQFQNSDSGFEIMIPPASINFLRFKIKTK